MMKVVYPLLIVSGKVGCLIGMLAAGAKGNLTMTLAMGFLLIAVMLEQLDDSVNGD